MALTTSHAPLTLSELKKAHSALKLKNNGRSLGSNPQPSRLRSNMTMMPLWAENLNGRSYTMLPKIKLAPLQDSHQAFGDPSVKLENQ